MSPLCSNPKAAATVEAKLKALPCLRPIELEKAAANACFVCLNKNIDMDSLDIAGEVVAEYKSQTNRNMNDFEASDALKKRWTGNALDLICEFLVSFYAVPQNDKLKHSLFSDELVSIGSAFIAHKKIG